MGAGGGGAAGGGAAGAAHKRWRQSVEQEEVAAASGALQVLTGVVAGRRWVARLSAGRASLEWGVDTYRGAKLLGAAVTLAKELLRLNCALTRVADGMRRHISLVRLVI